MNNVTQLKITSTDETFTRGTYNGIPVIIHDKDGFINATDMCKHEFDKKFEKIYENYSWQQYLKQFKANYYANQDKEPLYRLRHHEDEVRGTYVDPRLINYIAIWASPNYASYVCETIDTFHDIIHERLIAQQLQDIPRNVKPLLVKLENKENTNEKVLRLYF